MAISGNYSYIPVTDEFLAHWEEVDTALGAPGLVLSGAFDRAALVALRDSLATKDATIQAKLNDREIARGDIDAKKQPLRDRFDQFTARIRALYPDTKWLEALPLAPSLNDGEGKFLAPMDDALDLWQRIDNTIALPSGYLFDAFQDDLGDLREAYAAYSTAVIGLKLTREERNDTQETIRTRLVSYRQAVPSFFDKGNALIESLPRLSPKPGHTPEAVSLTGLWDGASSSALLEWTESTDNDLQDYLVLGCAAEEWDSDIAQTLATVPSGGTRQLSTVFGLGIAGAKATYRVEVRLNTGNTKLSNTAAVERPA